MKKISYKKLIIITGTLIIASVAIYNSVTTFSETSNTYNNHEYYYNDDTSFHKEDVESMASEKETDEITERAKIIDKRPSSITVLVNKEFSLPADYIPEDLVEPNVLFNFNYQHDKRMLRKVAAHALEDLFAAAEKKGLILYGISGYRSYARQKEIYMDNLRTMGPQHTNLYSARPGYSEHQTGLSIDVSTISINNRLDEGFAATPESRWLAKNCYKFGFIIRYPKDKCDITGYSYEPWHIRYVGKKLAAYLYKNNLTLEEYYNYTPSDSLIEDDSYGTVIDVDNEDYDEPEETKEPKETPKPTKTPTPSETPTPSPSPSPSSSVTPTPNDQENDNQGEDPVSTTEPNIPTTPSPSQSPNVEAPTEAPVETIIPTPEVTPSATPTEIEGLPSNTGTEAIK